MFYYLEHPYPIDCLDQFDHLDHLDSLDHLYRLDNLDYLDNLDHLDHLEDPKVLDKFPEAEKPMEVSSIWLNIVMRV